MGNHTLTDNAIRELAELKRQVQILVDERRQGRGRNIILRQHLAQASGTITAANYAVDPDTFGSGTVTLYKRNSDNEFETIKDGNGDAITVTVYNWVDEASASGAYVWVGQDSTGTWFFLQEAC